MESQVWNCVLTIVLLGEVFIWILPQHITDNCFFKATKELLIKTGQNYSSF